MEEVFTGHIHHISADSKFGFIKVDVEGVPDMFVMPPSCEAFGREIPPVGTPVQFTTTIDSKTGRPRAEGVAPVGDAAHSAEISFEEAAAASGRLTGVVGSGGKGSFGFIRQDNGEPDMFMLPPLPPPGARVSFECVIDAKTGRPRAENVEVDGMHVRQASFASFAPAPPQMGGFYHAAFPAQHATINGMPRFGAVPASRPPQHRVQPYSNSARTGGGLDLRKFITVDGQPLQQGRLQVLRPPQQGRFQAGQPLRHGTQQASEAREAAIFADALADAETEAFAMESQANGTVTSGNGKFGFITQDNGEPDMFLIPPACEMFGRELPPVGTRVRYRVVTDSKTGRLRADSVCPEV